MKKNLIATVVASCFMAGTIPAQAQTVSDNEIRIGVLTDLSGIYSAIEGPGAVLAAQMAAKDFGGQVLGIGAVDNTYNILFNRVRAYLNSTNGEKIGTKAFRRQELFLPHNTLNINGEDVISLSHSYDVDKNTYIGDVINQLINGWVDIAKDAWIFDIQGNKEISPTLLFLIQAWYTLKMVKYLKMNKVLNNLF